jgi:signal transduction histidine kinase
MSSRRLAIAALVPAAVAVGALSVAIARDEPGYSLSGRSLPWNALELVAGFALAATGLAFWGRGRFGPLAVAAGLGWLLVEWNNPGAGSALVFTVGLVLFLVCPPLVGHTALVYQGRRLRIPERIGLTAAYAGAVVVAGLLPALAFDSATGCGECPRNLLLAKGDEGAYQVFNRAGVQAGLGWSLLLILLLGWRLARATPASRLLAAPVLIAAGAYLGLVAADFAHSLGRGYLSNDPLDRQLWRGEAGALLLLSAGAAWSRLRARRTRAALARLVVELAGSPAPGALEAALARSLGDPALRLAYPLTDGRYVDADGRELTVEASATPLVRNGVEVARLSHRPGLLDDPELADAVARAARLALDHERLQAELWTQLEDLRASRARVLAAGDSERRRLERDLHDGAQQRLVGLSLQLRLARARAADPELEARIDEADAELRSALAEVRQVARGIFPAVLAEEGLAAAIESLAEESPTPVQIEALTEERLPAPVEAAAYALVSEAVRSSRSPLLTVGATRAGAALVVEIAGADGLTKPAEDRIVAADGTVHTVRGPDGAVTIRAEIPCAS